MATYNAKKLRWLVEQIMVDSEKSRSDDHLLLATTWYRLGFKLTQEQYNLFKTMPSAETVTRIRRKLQEQGKYQASKEVQKYRKHKSLVMQQNAPTEQLYNVIDNSYLEQHSLV